jgi:hypothetical protein
MGRKPFGIRIKSHLENLLLIRNSESQQKSKTIFNFEHSKYNLK